MIDVFQYYFFWPGMSLDLSHPTQGVLSIVAAQVYLPGMQAGQVIP